MKKILIILGVIAILLGAYLKDTTELINLSVASMALGVGSIFLALVIFAHEESFEG